MPSWFGSAAACGFLGKDGWFTIEFVLAHVLVHLFPALEDVAFGDFGVERVAVFQAAHGMAASTTDGFALVLAHHKTRVWA